MKHSERITTLAAYIRSNEPTSEEICELLDIVSDEFKASEDRHDRELQEVKKNFKKISNFLAIQAL